MKRTLAINSRGPEVAEAQGKLNIKPPTSLPPLAVDGIFGPKTLARVKEFQKNNQLDSDGIIGPKTWAKLDAAVPIPVKDSVVCANGCAHNHVNVMQCQHSFLAAFKKEPVVQALGFQTKSTTSVASFLPSLSLPSLPSLPSVKYTRLTAAQISTARGVYGSSLDFTRIFITDLTGAGNRPFTVAIPVPTTVALLLGLSGTIQVMNCGTLTPSNKLLIHELAHVWQSQHHATPTQFMVNSVGSQGLAVAANQAVALVDATVKTNSDFPTFFPTSSYAYSPGKAFGDYGAEQIANQVEHGVAAIVSHVAGVAMNAVDADNTTSLATFRIDDVRKPGVVP
jgi:hypothetical protein